MISIRSVVLLCALSLFTAPLAFANESQTTTNEKSQLRYFLGGKIGYSGINIDSIENKTLAKPANKYNDFLSSMGVGVFGGLQYTLLPTVGLRAELEYLYRLDVDSKKKNGYNYLTPPTGTNTTSATGNVELSLEMHTILANLYLDYYVTPKIAVYAGFGIGISIIETSIDAWSPGLLMDDHPEPDAESTNVDFAWQVGIGSRFFVTENIALDVNARYVGLTTSDTKLGNPALLRMKHGLVGAVEVLAGVSYVF